jgi:hypothetical protein
MVMEFFRLRLLTATLPLLLVDPAIGHAQVPSGPSRAEAQAALSPATPHYTRQQLDQMLAPIALYPDQLLAQVLMAATFPGQLVDAGRWLQDPANAALRGEELAAALQPLPWDPSVKSLVAFPQLIVMLTMHLDWTEAIGIAFTNQQVELMSRVQFLRDRALAAGRLGNTRNLRVTREDGYIAIEPADPDIVYVPVYDPAQVYGEWPDSDYPPVYLPPPPSFYGEGPSPGPYLGPAIGFSVGFGVVGALWGWNHPDWRRHEVVVDPGRYRRITSPRDNARNRVVIENNNTWRRTAPVAPVPAAARPAPAATPAPHPPGTVTPAAVAPHPRPPGAPAPSAPAPAVVRPPGAPPAPHQPGPATVRPPAPPHPPGTPAPSAPAPAVVRPPGAPPHEPGPAAVPPPAPHPEQAVPGPAIVRPPAPPRPPEHREPGPAVAHPPAPPRPEQAAPPPAAVRPPPPRPEQAVPGPVIVRPPAPPRPEQAIPPPAAVRPPPPRPEQATPPPAAVRLPAPQPQPAPPPAAAHPPGPPHPAPAKPPEKKHEEKKPEDKQ